MVMTARNWRAFGWNYARFFSHDAYPIHIEAALDSMRKGADGEAFVHLDQALSTVAQVAAITGDDARGKVYTWLIMMLRNQLLERYITDQDFLSGLHKLVTPDSLQGRAPTGEGITAYLTCLIRLDALTAPLSEVLEPARLKQCNEGEL
ncbi:MAG TPA: hypothetical protein ENK63_05840 [Rhodobacterales bacterium]|nr:hypothetical protein [Rhodobacterales bacterium]